MRIFRHFAIALAAAGSCAAASSAVAAAEPAGGGAPCGATASACVDLSSSQGWLMNGGQVTYGPVQLSTGAPDSETPTGTHQVLYKDKDHKSREFNDAPMPYSVFFTGSGMAFHEGDIDEQSNGCVHLTPDAAATFYDSLSPGDVVEVEP